MSPESCAGELRATIPPVCPRDCDNGRGRRPRMTIPPSQEAPAVAVWARARRSICAMRVGRKAGRTGRSGQRRGNKAIPQQPTPRTTMETPPWTLPMQTPQNQHLLQRRSRNAYSPHSRLLILLPRDSVDGRETRHGCLHICGIPSAQE